MFRNGNTGIGSINIGAYGKTGTWSTNVYMLCGNTGTLSMNMFVYDKTGTLSMNMFVYDKTVWYFVYEHIVYGKIAHGL